MTNSMLFLQHMVPETTTNTAPFGLCFGQPFVPVYVADCVNGDGLKNKYKNKIQ